MIKYPIYVTVDTNILDAAKYDLITEFDLNVFKDYFLKIIVDVIYKNVQKQTDSKIELSKKCSIEKAVASTTGNNSRQKENLMMLLVSVLKSKYQVRDLFNQLPFAVRIILLSCGAVLVAAFGGMAMYLFGGGGFLYAGF